MPSAVPPNRVGDAPSTKAIQRPAVPKRFPTLRGIFSENLDLSLSDREDLIIEWVVRILRKLKEGYDGEPSVCCMNLSLDTITLKGKEIVLEMELLRDRNFSQIQGNNLRSLAVLIYEAYTEEKPVDYDKLRKLRHMLPEKLKGCVEKCGCGTVDEVLKELGSSIDKPPKPRSKSKHSGSGRRHGSTHASKSYEASTLPPNTPSFSSVTDVSNALTAASANCLSVEPSVFGPTRAAPTREISILLIGESGVGKSTLINTFWLCSQFSDPSAIPLADTRWPIPVSFVFDGVEISGGENGTDALGDSATQAPQDYYFNYILNGLPVRICVIDTPGMGDT
ncbi:Hypothetical protein GLP15_2818 [Giardia lamblia P15]|uniref:Septin-type G domain-containing protein n=1 Tax=Giardia intestinalis (strain P15) TaxID=658858 RepID=E1F8Y7_GIAIA|nr:Hypothetical protein GLP15_2818 [Giardia lamblia P15]